MEYQRRFLLSSIPKDVIRPGTLIRQVYWALGNAIVVRLRLSGDEPSTDHTIAFKGLRTSAARVNLEFRAGDAPSLPENDDLAKQELDYFLRELYMAGHANQVVKTRYWYPHNGISWTIDEFHLRHQGLIICETGDASAEFVDLHIQEDWLGMEITDFRIYDNERLAFDSSLDP